MTSFLPDPSINYVGWSAPLKAYADAARAVAAVSASERRSVRESAGVPRKDLAELLEVPVDRVRRYEEGAAPTGLEAYRYWVALEAMKPPEKPYRFDAAERAKMSEYFTNNEVCPNCRGVHTRACPRVKSVSYHDNGTLKSVEYWPDGQWPQDAVIFPDSPEMNDD